VLLWKLDLADIASWSLNRKVTIDITLLTCFLSSDLDSMDTIIVFGRSQHKHKSKARYLWR